MSCIAPGNLSFPLRTREIASEVAHEHDSRRRPAPVFFWDYEITDDQVRAILRDGEPFDKAWVMSRILQHARWDDIWRYLTVADIRLNFENLSFRRPQDRELWAYALDRWAKHG